MNTAHDERGSAQDTGALPRSTVSDGMESARHEQGGTTAGPAGFARPPIDSPSTGNISGKSERDEAESSKQPLEVIKNGFADAQQALTSGYKTVSSSTNEFVHKSPWESVVFAMLGGVIVGMLAAR
jgi:ElaB/YqjD/DUF883 family membrane-anchored ribosome-binding protein